MSVGSAAENLRLGWRRFRKGCGCTSLVRPSDATVKTPAPGIGKKKDFSPKNLF
jgi:hypothetical protein